MNGVLFDADRPWGVVAGPQHGLGTCGKVPRVFLYVPLECARVTLTCEAVSPREGGRVILHRPDGSEALVLDGEFDTAATGSADVPDDARGKVWSLDWAAPQSVKASLDDLVLSVDGDLAPVLWRERTWAEKHGPEVWATPPGRHRGLPGALTGILTHGTMGQPPMGGGVA